MGGSRWSDDFYTDRVVSKVNSGTPIFDYDASIKAGTTTAKVHDKLDPAKMKGGIREARDSDAHPRSKPIIVAFDQTGSMREVPVLLQKKLPQLMGLLLRKNYIQDPQVCFACFGDYYNGERAPFQVGQFESGVEMDDDLTKFYLEGSGGGGHQESYENVFYFAARKTKTDAWEKRSEKGYLFLIGDETPYNLTPDEAEAIFGDKIQGEITVEDLVKEAAERWEIFFLIPKGAGHEGASWLKDRWVKLLDGQRVITIDPELVCEAIGSVIGLMEGVAPSDADALASDLKSAGVSDTAAHVVSAAVDPLAKALVKVGTGSLPERADRSSSIERI